MANFEVLYSPQQVCEFLKSEIPTISDDILEKVIAHKIDGEVFLEMDDEYLREIAPLVGDRIKIKRAIRTAVNMTSRSLSSTPVSTNSTDLDMGACSVMTKESLLSGPITPSVTKKSTPRSIISEGTISRSETDLDSLSDDLNFEMDQDDSIKKPGTWPPTSTPPISVSTPSTSGSISTPSTSRVQQKGDSAEKNGNTNSLCSISGKMSKQPPAEWANTFTIPTRFSVATTSTMKSGVLTPKARDEIVHSLATLIMVHTAYPSPSDYKTVLSKLVKKHPVLKDCVGSGYDSWKKKLIQKFKNLRRPERAEKAGIEIPPAKRRRGDEEETSSSPSPSASDRAEYDKHIQHLQKIYASQKWSLANMSSLLDETATQRRRWIMEDCPSVKDILSKFPCLKESKLMIKEFCKVTGLIEEDLSARWSDVEERVLRYAPFDDKKAVKSLLTSYNVCEDKNADCTTTYVLLLLTAMICPRGKGKKIPILNTFEGESICIEKALGEVDLQAPFIAAFGINKEKLTDIKLVIEGENIIPMPSMAIALHCCFAAYYLYNISYPLEFSPVLMFLETYVYGLKASKKLPLSVSLIVDSLERI